MKATVYKNVDLVQIPLQAGVTEYYFPTNVQWADKKVDKLVFCTIGKDTSFNAVSPIDGTTPVRTDLQNLYVSLYTADDLELVHNLDVSMMSDLCNYPVMVNAQLNLQLCRLNFRTEITTAQVLLIYVFYDSKCVEDYEQPRKSITANFELAAGAKITFRELVNTYIHALSDKVKAIVCMPTDDDYLSSDDPVNRFAYLTLRDHKLENIFNSVATTLLQPADLTQTQDFGLKTQVHTFYTDNIDIDFDYSFIRNASNDDAAEMIITFYF